MVTEFSRSAAEGETEGDRSEFPCFSAGSRLIIPERIEPAIIGGGAEGVGQPEIEQGAKSRAGFGEEKRVARPGGRVGAILRSRKITL